MPLKNAPKTLIPRSIWEQLSKRYRRLRQDLSWKSSSKGAQSRRQIRERKGRFKGERAFLIGNGPSLKDMDLSPLRDEFTFGLNRIYLLFPKMGFPTSFLVSVNRLVIEQFSDEIAQSNSLKFIGWRARNDRFSPTDTIYLNNKIDFGFSKNLPRHVYEVGTVTYIAMQLAFYMGFKKVILIGVDHSFETKGRPHQEQISPGPDRDHFDPNYFGKGIRWNLPDLETSEKAYRLARYVFEKDGRQIVDATINGKLQIFPKVSYLEQF